MSFLLTALAGFLSGFRHALEPDHLCAVSALAVEQKSLRGGFLTGLSWGLGHALTLVCFGGLLAFLGVSVPESIAAFLEVVVGIWVVVLGIGALRLSMRLGRQGPTVPHEHGENVHTHPSLGSHVHFLGVPLSTRPLMVGALHGLSGSGAMVALVSLQFSARFERLAFLAVFGVGAILSMTLLTYAAGFSISKYPQYQRILSRSSGLVSIAVGSLWIFLAVR